MKKLTIVLFVLAVLFISGCMFFIRDRSNFDRVKKDGEDNYKAAGYDGSDKRHDYGDKHRRNEKDDGRDNKSSTDDGHDGDNK